MRKYLTGRSSPNATAICLHLEEINAILIYSALKRIPIAPSVYELATCVSLNRWAQGSNVTSKPVAHVVPRYEKLVVNRGEPRCFAVGANITVTVRSLVASFLHGPFLLLAPLFSSVPLLRLRRFV